jgi:radical SAM protein with 4Fe4S-binding SPASM domain
MVTLFEDKEIKNDLRVCPAGIISCSVTVEGDLYPCPYFPKPVGNVFEASLKKIWDESKFLDELRKEEYLGKECKTCKFNLTCRGGCRALSYTHYNTITKKDPFCWIE